MSVQISEVLFEFNKYNLFLNLYVGSRGLPTLGRSGDAQCVTNAEIDFKIAENNFLPLKISQIAKSK